MARRYKTSLAARLTLLNSPEARRALPAKELRQRVKDVELAIARVRGKVCSGAWADAVVYGLDLQYPPPADDPACRMRRVVDLDGVVALQAGQSRDRLYPSIYVASTGHSFDAVIEASERRRHWLAHELGETLGRRRSSVVAWATKEEGQYAESLDVSPL